MSGYYEGWACDAEQDRVWGGDGICEHKRMLELLASVATENDCGDALDEAVDFIISDTAEGLREWVKLAVSGKDDEAVGRLMRGAVEQWARWVVAHSV